VWRYHLFLQAMTSIVGTDEAVTEPGWRRVVGNTYVQVDLVKFMPAQENGESFQDRLSLLPDFLLKHINLFLVGIDGFKGAHRRWTEHEEISGASILGPSNLRSIKTKNYMQLVGDYRNNNMKWAHQTLYAIWWRQSSRGISNLQMNSYAWVLERFSNFLATMSRLDLKWKQIDDNMAEAMAAGLVTNTTIESLDLGRNQIRSRGGIALAACLRENRTLKILGLHDNAIGDDGVAALAEALNSNTSLTSLDVAANSLSDTSLYALKQVLETKTTLTRLNVASNKFSQEGIEAMKQWPRAEEVLEPGWARSPHPSVAL